MVYEKRVWALENRVKFESSWSCSVGAAYSMKGLVRCKGREQYLPAEAIVSVTGFPSPC